MGFRIGKVAGSIVPLSSRMIVIEKIVKLFYNSFTITLIDTDVH